MKISELGEFGLIDLISKSASKRKGTVVGIGDDCAVIELSGASPNYLLVTTDAMIENVHFRRKGLSFFKLGQKAMTANVSDISAMGGRPTYALVTVGLPKNIKVEQVRELYKGIRGAAEKEGIGLVGGDTVASPKEIVLSVAMLGEVEKEYLLTRSGAGPGDLICVTGRFGGPASQKFDIRDLKLNIRSKEARAIAKARIATSMIDSSDGLVRSVIELCKASKTGALIDEEQVPAAKGAGLAQALYGGEEYELVFTVPFGRLKEMPAGVRNRVTIIGNMTRRGEGIRLIDAEGRMKGVKGGYEHFKR